jgi:hypothetical protein
MCKCKWFAAILAVIVFILALWPNLFGAAASKWIIAIAAVIIFIGAIACNHCGECCDSKVEKPRPSPRRAKRRR